MLYSVKMRSAQGGPHEQGGRHISGAERILSEEKIEQAIVAMLHRAQKHQRGMADFISLKVEAVKTADIFYRPLLPLSSCLFEAASAVGTVGLTLGITPKLHILSQIILIILMYLGRVGGLTLIYAVFSDKNKRKAKLPLDKIIVG